MAKNKNTFEKRRKEMKRKEKAQEKRERRFARRHSSVESETPDEPVTERGADAIDCQSGAAP